MGAGSNGASTVTTSPALTRAEQLVEQQDEVREELLRDRAAYMAIIERIDAALRHLAPAVTKDEQKSPRPQLAKTASKRSFATGREDTIPGMLQSIIGATPGINSTAIIAGIKKMRPRLKPRDVHANLYRLKVNGRIRIEGERGHGRYFLVSAETASA